MILKFERNDITKMNVDCIVNAANNTLLGGGGVDGQIHAQAGPDLLKECMTLGGCETGDAKITKGYNLKAKFIIHTVGPIYQDGKHGEEKLLYSCYYKSLELAKKNDVKTIAFPLISSGIYGYPKKDAINVAIKAINQFGKDNEDYDTVVTLVFFGLDAVNLDEKIYGDIKSYIDDNYVDKKNKIYDRRIKNGVGNYVSIAPSVAGRVLRNKKTRSHKMCAKLLDKELSSSVEPSQKLSKDDLADLIDKLDSSFSDALLKTIDKKKLKDSDVYNKANIDRKLFSKIRNGSHPKRETALALCIALELTIDETNNLIKKAGFTLSNSSKFDVIVTYYIEHKKYDINEINAVLFSFDQKQLGPT